MEWSLPLSIFPWSCACTLEDWWKSSFVWVTQSMEVTQRPGLELAWHILSSLQAGPISSIHPLSSIVSLRQCQWSSPTEDAIFVAEGAIKKGFSSCSHPGSLPTTACFGCRLVGLVMVAILKVPHKVPYAKDSVTSLRHS